MSEGSSIVFFARDPGGANAVAGAYEAWETLCLEHYALSETCGHCVATMAKSILAKDYASATFATLGLAAEDWAVASQNYKSIEELLSTKRCGALTSATNDIDDDTYLDIWRAAQQQGIPVIAVLDDPQSLQFRFGIFKGQPVWPDLCLVADEALIGALRAVGLPSTVPVLVSGDLHLAAIRRRADTLSDSTIAALRRQWDADGDALVILFASSAYSEMGAAGRTNVGDEHQSLTNILERIDRGWRPGPNGTPLVVIRPHPRDEAHKYERYLKRGSVAVIVSNAGTSFEAILAADVVTGTSPAVLREAHLLGARVVEAMHQPTRSNV